MPDGLSGRIAGGNTKYKRVASDFYPTPYECTEALVKYLSLPSGLRVWEPAVGQGHITQVLSQHGMICTGTDIETGVDFLECDKMPGVQDWIITNPPWSLAEAFILKAYEFKIPFAMLLKSQFWHSKNRMATFMRCRPAYVLAMTWRPDFLNKSRGSGSPFLDCIWTVWQDSLLQSNGGHTVYDLLLRP